MEQAMKKILLGTASILALIAGGAANAADVVPTYKAAPVGPAPFAWTGFYVGAHLGAGMGLKEFFHVPTDPADAPSAGTLDGSGTVTGFLGGGQAGYNYQIDWAVLGVEGDITWSGLSGSFVCFTGSGPESTFVSHDSCSAKATWLATATGRIGGTVDHALLYLKGGVAWVHDDYSDRLGCDGFTTSNGSETRTGWTVGCGVEYAFSRNWSGKIEYDYMDFGTKTVTFTGPVDTFAKDISEHIHVAKAGLNYKFDWSAPVVARY
jgi:outer membrane immunogenic protein